MATIYGKNYGKPSLDLNFAGNKSLIDTTTGTNYVTFSRAQSGNEATYVGSDGLIKYASADEPRFDHDPTTNASLGLLIEESRTNVMTNSTSPSWNANAFGTGTTPTVTLVSNAAPDGSTNSAQRFQFDRGTGNTSNDYSLVSITTSAASVLHSVSVWMRSNDSNTYTIIFYDAGGQKAEEIIVTPSWKRYILDASTSYKGSNQSSYSSPNLIFGLRNDPPAVGYFTGNNNSQTADILAWGPQIEAGSFATSYIPTSGSTETRAADEASITGTNFSSWYNPTEGSFFMDEKNSYGPTLAKRFELIQNSSPNTNAIAFTVNYGAGTSILSRESNAAGTIGSTLFNVWASGGNHKYGYGLKLNDTVVVSGSNIATDSACTLPPNLDALDLGATNRAGSISNLAGKFTLSRLTYYPKRLPDIELQQLTK